MIRCRTLAHEKHISEDGKKLTLLVRGTCQIRKKSAGERMLDQNRKNYLAISTNNTVLLSTYYFQSKNTHELNV